MLIAAPSAANIRLLRENRGGPQLLRGNINEVLKLGTNNITHIWRVNIHRNTSSTDPSVQRSARSRTQILEIPLFVFQVPLPAQAALRDLLGVPLALGNFEFSFSELSQHSEGLGDLPIKKLRQYLTSQEQNAQEQVEVFGLKFSGSALGSWGLIFLAGLQLYFVVSLRFFVKVRLQHQWLHPWLALYPDKLSQIMFVLSGLIFPTVIVLMLGYDHINGPLELLHTSFVIIGSVGSLLALSWSLFLYRRLQAVL